MHDQPETKDQGSGQKTEPAAVEPPRPKVPFVPGPLISEPDEKQVRNTTANKKVKRV